MSKHAIDNGAWKQELFEKYDLRGGNRDYFMNMCSQHVKDVTGKDANKRIYIGPGREGSSEDKMPINIKFDPQNIEVPRNKNWGQQNYKKTSFAWYDGEDDWDIVECQHPLDHKVEFAPDKKPNKLVIILHPYVRNPLGFKRHDEDACAYMAVDPDYDFEEDAEDFEYDMKTAHA